MDIKDIRKTLHTEPYNFLKENKHLGDNVALLTVGGSHAYGMSTKDSDIDIRGISLNSKSDILLGEDFEQAVDIETDTTVYSSNKMINLLQSNNPNTLEILGCLPEHYMYLNDIGRMFIDNRRIFLSQVCAYTFSGYAVSQLRRLQNKSARKMTQAELEQYILKSVQNARLAIDGRYADYTDDNLKLYIDKSLQEDFDSEIFMDINFEHYPLRDWTGLWNELKQIVSSYAKNSMRNEKAIAHNKLGKHMAHLIRLYMTGIDILEKGDIITYRAAEHDLLMSIRNGEYLDSNSQATSAFYDILNEYEKRFEYAKENTSLQEKPDIKKIKEFKQYINEQVVKNR